VGFNRICGFAGYVNCPGANNTVIVSKNATTITWDYPNGYDIRLPRNITEAFQSGLANMPSTVSSLFDIQWRTYQIKKDKYIGKGNTTPPYAEGAFRSLQSFVLNDDFEAAEGVIVDSKFGSIGFRNHTVPPPLKYGSEWTEDILFIEPETACVDMNLTIDFVISADGFGSIKNLTLTDRGGFANFDKQIPAPYDYNDTQAKPNLHDRAQFAALYSNIYSMLYLNVTNPKPNRFRYLNSTVGQQFPLTNWSSSDIHWTPTYDSLRVDQDYGAFLDLPEAYHDGNQTFFSNYSTTKALYKNPFHITTANFSDIGM
jgi:hypothetical protein